MVTHTTERAAEHGASAPEIVSGPPDPNIIGVPFFALGSISLGLALVGYVPARAAAGVLPIVFVATGIGVFVAAIWAIALGDTMLAGILALFAGFWWSYTALQLGLEHGWYGVPLGDVVRVRGDFIIAWTVIFVCLTLATLRLPLLYTTLLGLVDVSCVLLVIGTLAGSASATRAAGIVVLIFGTQGLYLFVHSCEVALGGRGLPLGRPLIR